MGNSVGESAVRELKEEAEGLMSDVVRVLCGVLELETWRKKWRRDMVRVILLRSCEDLTRAAALVSEMKELEGGDRESESGK